MNADRQNPWIVVEDGLHAIAVMDVHIHVSDAFRALPQQPGDRDRGIVVDAEAGGGVRHCMVQATGDVDGVLSGTGPDRLGCRDGGTCNERACGMHAFEDRIVGRAEAVRRIST